MIHWDSKRVVSGLARRYLEEDVVGRPVRGDVQAVKVEVRRLRELIRQSNPDLVARYELHTWTRHLTVEAP
jgi:hypothetical protein